MPGAIHVRYRFVCDTTALFCAQETLRIQRKRMVCYRKKFARIATFVSEESTVAAASSCAAFVAI